MFSAVRLVIHSLIEHVSRSACSVSEHDDVDGQGDRVVVEPQPAHEDLTDVAGAGDSDEHIHVHVAGSRAKLGHDLKTRRRATRKQGIPSHMNHLCK